MYLVVIILLNLNIHFLFVKFEVDDDVAILLPI